MDTVVYTCVTAGYDSVAPVDTSWKSEFILFHDGSVDVPAGWRGVKLNVPGLVGAELNRYAKILPHRLGLDADKTLYVDGNIYFRRDPSPEIRNVLEKHRFAAFDHPELAGAYQDIRRALEVGFASPLAALRITKILRRIGVKRDSRLFECNVLYRRHNDPDVVSLGEQWWRLWGLGYHRDQPLLMAASLQTGEEVTSLGRNSIRSGEHDAFGLRMHVSPRSRRGRMLRRLAAELMLFRLWLPE